MRKRISVCWTLPPEPAPRKAFGRDWTTPGGGRSGQQGSSLMSSKCDMAYVVNITLRAQRDLDHLYNEIDVSGSDAAQRWYKGLKKQILSLEKLPNRCPVT